MILGDSAGAERGPAIKRSMLRGLPQHESEVIAAAQLVESDLSFAEAVAVSKWSDAQAVDLLSRYRIKAYDASGTL